MATPSRLRGVTTAKIAVRCPVGFPSGQRGRAVNPLALPSQVRILPPPSSSPGGSGRRFLAGAVRNGVWPPVIAGRVGLRLQGLLAGGTPVGGFSGDSPSASGDFGGRSAAVARHEVSEARPPRCDALRRLPAGRRWSPIRSAALVSARPAIAAAWTDGSSWCSRGGLVPHFGRSRLTLRISGGGRRGQEEPDRVERSDLRSNPL